MHTHPVFIRTVHNTAYFVQVPYPLVVAAAWAAYLIPLLVLAVLLKVLV